MRLLYLAAFWVAGISMGLAFDARPLGLFLLTLSAIPFGILVSLAGRSPAPVVLIAVLLLAFWRVEIDGTPAESPAAAAVSEQQRATVTGRVVDDPEARSRNIRFTMKVESVDLGDVTQETSSKVLVYAEPPRSLVSLRPPPFFRYGDRIIAQGTLKRPEPFQGFDYPSYLESKGISAVLWARQVEVEDSDNTGFPGSARREIFSIRRSLSGSLVRNLTAPQSALAQALLLGIRGQLPPEVVNDFRHTGAAHLLAISGLHVGVLLFLVMGLVSRTIGRGRLLYFLLPLAAIWMYALTSGLPVSVVRAGIMGSTVLAALALGRPRRVLPALALAAAIMAAIDPKVLGQVSFQLSFTAVGGIALVLPMQTRVAEAISNRMGNVNGTGGWWRVWLGWLAVWIATALLVSAAASLATWPLVAYYFQRIPWTGIPVTILALPALPFALAGSLATAAAGLVQSEAGQIFGWIAWIPLTYMLKLVSATPHITTGGAWVGGPVLALWYGTLASILLLPGGLPRLVDAAKSLHRSMVPGDLEPAGASGSTGVAIPGVWVGITVAGLGVAFMLWWQVLSGPSGMLHVFFFDVGQGDSALIVTPRGRQVLVDGGPANQAAVEALGGELAFWDKSLDIVVMTHLDADHSRGLIEVLERYRVGGVLTGSDHVDAPLYPQWEAALKRNGLDPVEVELGYRIDLDPGSTPAVTLEVLNPRREVLRPPAADLNNNAVVLRLDYGEVSIMLASDVEAEAEAGMALGEMRLASDLLKVPHHGSKTSTTDPFLERVDPEIAVISVGSGNTYGHPDSGVLSRLQNVVEADRIYRTDLHGTIEVISDGVSLWVDNDNK